MSWNLFFMNLGVAYAATWVFKVVDFIEGGTRMRKHERRTREQRKADASAWIGFMSFLDLLLITISYMVVSAR